MSLQYPPQPPQSPSPPSRASHPHTSTHAFTQTVAHPLEGSRGVLGLAVGGSPCPHPPPTPSPMHRRCRHTFCEKHGKKKHQPPPFAEDDEQEVRVCDDCCKIWQKEAQVARVARRKERVHDYLNKRLEPYVQDQTDTTKAKMTRVAHGAYKVSKVCLPHHKR